MYSKSHNIYKWYHFAFTFSTPHDSLLYLGRAAPMDTDRVVNGLHWLVGLSVGLGHHRPKRRWWKHPCRLVGWNEHLMDWHVHWSPCKGKWLGCKGVRPHRKVKHDLLEAALVSITQHEHATIHNTFYCYKFLYTLVVHHLSRCLRR